MSELLIPKAVIFDWDNTLVDTWPLIQRAVDETMVNMGREPWGLKRVKENVQNSMRESFPLLFGKRWEEAGKFYRASYHASHLSDLRFLEGAPELLNNLHKKGVTLMIVSNKIGDTLRKEVEHLGIKDKFFSVIGSMDARYDKPSKEMVDLALKGSNLKPEEDLLWFIGDTMIDIECAYNSKCQPVLYGNSPSVTEDFIKKAKRQSEKPLLHFANHWQILSYFESLM